MQNLTYQNSIKKKKKIINHVSLVTLIPPAPRLEENMAAGCTTVTDLSGYVNWEQSEKENSDKRDAYNF